jgi:DNA-binding NtrC family response regulator
MVAIDRLIGISMPIVELRRTILQFAPLDAPVLITGETGTGKELVARALHESSPRAAGPFVPVNCGAISDSLLESELFGHEKGSFTGAYRTHQGVFEQAGEGTILLDEIGEISPRLQIALLRVLETAEVRPVGRSLTFRSRCRILASTNADLERLVQEGRFRIDLYYRLRQLQIRIPPLRARRQDIPVLASHFLDLGRPAAERAEMSRELQAELTRRDWPGNVRELRSEIERMRLLNSDRLFYGLDHLAGTAPSGDPDDVQTVLQESRAPIRRLGRLRDLFSSHRELTRGEVARILRISLNTATRDLKRLCREGFVEKVEPTASPRTHYFIRRPI